MVIAECAPGEAFLRRPAAGEGFLVMTNHFSSASMRAHNASNWDVCSSERRYQTAHNALKNTRCVDGVRHAQDMLSGKHSFICQYESALNFETI